MNRSMDISQVSQIDKRWLKILHNMVKKAARCFLSLSFDNEDDVFRCLFFNLTNILYLLLLVGSNLIIRFIYREEKRKKNELNQKLILKT